MSLSTLPLGYCTNVHPGRTPAEVVLGLQDYAARVRDRVGGPMAVGLWLAKPVIDGFLGGPDRLPSLAGCLSDLGLTCYTLNAFPYGDFHAARVKENVYRPDWSDPARQDYTIACAEALAALLPDGADGSISTLPLGFKGFDHPPNFADRCAARLTAVAVELRALAGRTGKTIRLAIEPEPCCRLETTAETVRFFEYLWRVAAAAVAEDAVREHVGVCYDVCHQAVEFEDVGESVRTLDAAGVRINKVQISCAVEVARPADNPAAVAALGRYAEPRYLHQTFARLPGGRVVSVPDLTAEFLANPGPEFLEAEAWRVHFHVPVDVDRLGPLGTTRPAVREALAAVGRLGYAPHLEVETYTWEVMPGSGPPDIVAGLAAEIAATRRMIGN